MQNSKTSFFGWLKANALPLAVLAAGFYLVAQFLEFSLNENWDSAILSFFLLVVGYFGLVHVHKFIASKMGWKATVLTSSFMVAWVGIAFAYAVLVPFLAELGYNIMGLGGNGAEGKTWFVQFLFHTAAAVVMIALAYGVYYVAENNAIPAPLKYIVGGLTTAFVILIGFGWHGGNQLETAQTETWKRQTQSAVTTLGNQAPPYTSFLGAVAKAKKPYEQIVQEGGLAGNNARNAVMQEAAKAAAACKKLPAALDGFVANVVAIPLAEAGGGAVTSASGQSGQGPRYKALARLTQGLVVPFTPAVQDAMADVTALVVPTTASVAAANTLAELQASCAVLSSELTQRVERLEIVSQGSLGSAFSVAEASYVKQQQFAPVILSASSVLQNTSFPDLSLLTTQEAETSEVALARQEIIKFDAFGAAVTGYADTYKANAEALAAEVSQIDWATSRSQVDEAVGEVFAKAEAMALAFNGAQSVELSSLAASTNNQELESAVAQATVAYNAPDVSEPTKLSRTGMWFGTGFEGLWKFVEAVGLAIALETLILLSFTYLAFFVGSMIFTARNQFYAAHGMELLTSLVSKSIQPKKGLKARISEAWHGVKTVSTQPQRREPVASAQQVKPVTPAVVQSPVQTVTPVLSENVKAKITELAKADFDSGARPNASLLKIKSIDPSFPKGSFSAQALDVYTKAFTQLSMADAKPANADVVSAE